MQQESIAKVVAGISRVWSRRTIVILALAASGFLPLPAASETELALRTDLKAPFEQQKVKGVIVIFDSATGKAQTNDIERAKKQYIPASTFKIPNSLIGLNVGAVKGIDEVLPYGGKPQPFKEWEKDMNLRDAIKVSNVAVYQELARRIGLERMQGALRELGYGNMEAGPVVDQFWLSGPLKISALEQTQFLAKLVSGSLPVSPKAVSDVKEITLLEKSAAVALHAKTGWCIAYRPGPDLGWWVGWVEDTATGRVVTFALNIDMAGKVDIAKRQIIGKACLKLAGVVLPGE
ncbi:class D beta-lactamase [Verrucomicrobium sp. BvORR106]|uniref:class D beta-lactamase n=1 Tax=Verrucomicrobium sp. BvORR106 TaxID=1403819 RepID=UPI00068A6E3C